MMFQFVFLPFLWTPNRLHLAAVKIVHGSNSHCDLVNWSNTAMALPKRAPVAVGKQGIVQRNAESNRDARRGWRFKFGACRPKSGGQSN